MNPEQWKAKKRIIDGRKPPSGKRARTPQPKARPIGPLGVPRMDGEHAMLAELIERLDTVCCNPDAADRAACRCEATASCTTALRHIADLLVGYMRDHFRYEESLMESNLPSAYKADHKADHAMIENRLNSLVYSIQLGGSTSMISRFMADEVREWLGKHAETHDIILASFVASENSQ